MPSPSKPVQVLLVEDSPDDADLMVEALEEGTLDVRISRVGDGEQALLYVHRQGPYAAAPRPDLILLDLQLPRKNGHEVLRELKCDPDLRRIPVVVLTSFDTEQAIGRAYELYANCCVRKPADLDEYAAVVRKIEHFWLQVASRAPGQ